VDPLVAEIDSIIGSLYGAADGIDGQLTENGDLVSLPMLALDVASLAARAQDGPKRYRLSFALENVGGADATDADVHIELLSAYAAGVTTPDFHTGTLKQNTQYSGTMDLDIEPGLKTLSIAVSLTAEGGGTWTDVRSIPVPDISTEAERAPLADAVTLEQNYPNPFNPVTTIRYTLPRNMEVSLVVTDPLGRELYRLIDCQIQQSGAHSVRFDAGSLSSGVYFYRLATTTRVLSRRMLLLR
jgi:hypothetical protein